MKRVNTPSKTFKQQLFSEVTPVVDDDSLDMHHYDGPKFVHTDKMELIVDKLVKLLPAATRELKEIGRLENKRNTLFPEQSTINLVCQRPFKGQ